ncbi:MAG: hypothetical protein IPI50_02495 [Saprospiraceae bacterium]|nr:hypothetical protein [Saprospiraceae bacterium]
MIRFIILGLAAYGLYVLFFQKKKRVDAGPKRSSSAKEYSDYEEIK